MNRAKFTKNQNRIFWGLFISYGIAYVGRLNLSAALNNLITDMSLTKAQGGMFQTLFAIVYAAGQLINGVIVDKVSARRYIFAGLLLSGLANLLLGISKAYPLMLTAWLINGAVQSMLWTPVVKIMATWFKGDRREKASFGLSITLVCGNIAAWAISGFMAARFSWRYSFIIPGIIVGSCAFLAWFILRDKPEEGEDIGEDEVQKKGTTALRQMTVREMIALTGLPLVLVCCVCNGAVRDGIITWGPTILAQVAGGQALNSTLTSLIIPCFNLIGIVMARKCYNFFGNNARRCCGCLMLLSTVLCALIRPSYVSMVTCAITLGLACACTYGINPMLTTLIPMEFEVGGRVGLVAGISDCFIYLGSALAGVVTGAISDAAGWTMVFMLWVGIAAVGAVFAFLSLNGRKKLLSWGNGK